MNFYSYSPIKGMQYHPTGAEAKQAAEDALRLPVPIHPETESPALQVTWGEVTERAVSTGVGYALKRQDRLSYEASNPQVVDGKMHDSQGNLILLKNIHDSDLLEHDLVLSVATIWQVLSGKITRFKQHNFEDVTTFVDLLFERYNAKRGGTEGNMTFTTFDRRYKLSIAVQKTIDFGPEIEVARVKMLEAVEAMGGDSDLKTIVNAAYTQIDGKIRVAEVLRLRTYKINNQLWNDAMQVVNDAIEVISKKKQIRLYERNEQGKYIAIPLDIAAL